MHCNTFVLFGEQHSYVLLMCELFITYLVYILLLCSYNRGFFFCCFINLRQYIFLIPYIIFFMMESTHITFHKTIPNHRNPPRVVLMKIKVFKVIYTFHKIWLACFVLNRSKRHNRRSSPLSWTRALIIDPWMWSTPRIMWMRQMQETGQCEYTPEWL